MRFCQIALVDYFDRALGTRSREAVVNREVNVLRVIIEGLLG